MNRPRAVIIGAVVAALAAAIWFFSPPSDAIDLVALFPAAQKRTPHGSAADAVSVIDATLGGETRRAITAPPISRIIWRVRVPPDAELQTALGLRQEVWDQPGDGVQFRIGISDGEEYAELTRLIVNPRGQPEDRRWVPVVFDLSRWADQDVEVIFNTEYGPADNGDHDAAVWGAPRIVPKP